MIKSLTAVNKTDGSGLNDEQKAKLETFKGFVEDMLRQLAPSRYQFTETTLAVKLGLAQSTDISVDAAFGANLGAVAVNAGLSMVYGQDYRAAAEVTSVIHAIPADKVQMKWVMMNGNLSHRSFLLCNDNNFQFSNPLG